MHDILSDIIAESLKNKAKPENKKIWSFCKRKGVLSGILRKIVLSCLKRNTREEYAMRELTALLKKEISPALGVTEVGALSLIHI